MKVRDRILARLRESPGEFVPLWTLIESVWSTHPPADPVGGIRRHILRLRQSGALVESKYNHGYRLVEP